MSVELLAGRRILVVEDDYMIAQDVRDELEEAGAVVIGPVPTVGQALQLIEKEPDLAAAVLDVNLGTERSFPVAEALTSKGVPFLFSTGYNSADIPSEWRQVMTTMKPLRVISVMNLLRASGVNA